MYLMVSFTMTTSSDEETSSHNESGVTTVANDGTRVESLRYSLSLLCLAFNLLGLRTEGDRGWMRALEVLEVSIIILSSRK